MPAMDACPQELDCAKRRAIARAVSSAMKMEGTFAKSCRSDLRGAARHSRILSSEVLFRDALLHAGAVCENYHVRKWLYEFPPSAIASILFFEGSDDGSAALWRWNRRRASRQPRPSGEDRRFFGANKPRPFFG
jgi:hypothetical protein